MKTRFDDNKVWHVGTKSYVIETMETAHLMNLLKMFEEKPYRTMRMIVEDIEQNEVFAYGKRAESKTESLWNATSMTAEELIDFALNSPLAMAVSAELMTRGVNLENVMTITVGSSFDASGVR